MRLAVLGGSFNPIHLGHLYLADVVLSALHYDRVVMVPAYCSPFKPAAEGMESNAHHRLEMIAASIAGDPRLTVDDCEIERGGVSYTADTITDIIRRYHPEGKPGLIIGDDLAADFPQWNNSEQILAMADIIIARRTRSGNVSVPYPNIQITNDIMEISSGLVREKIAGDAAWRYLVPAAARVIIESKGLYGLAAQPLTQDDNTSPSRSLLSGCILRVEEAARESLSQERFLHSRNTALLSWDMCRRFQTASRFQAELAPDLGYLAGIAHDLGKQLPDKMQLKLAKSDGKDISQMEKDKPSLLHGRASAVLLRERFHIQNEAVLEAVAMHTYGGSDMGPLAKIVYIADKLEVSRENVNPAARKLAFTGDNLDEIFITVLDFTVSSLRSRKLKLSEETLNLLEKMRKIK
ncbi:MAG: nicotinate (nicotinamide) nucleotide adenylyltransferase [Treponema sp.]|nr:nicotinate (nicotinamide) nucleotide adenylyltransferase [Treponema sp.]